MIFGSAYLCIMSSDRIVRGHKLAIVKNGKEEECEDTDTLTRALSQDTGKGDSAAKKSRLPPYFLPKKPFFKKKCISD